MEPNNDDVVEANNDDVVEANNDVVVEANNDDVVEANNDDVVEVNNDHDVPEESEISIRLGRVEAGRPFTLLRPKFRICGKCGIGGHYKTTCPKNYETRGGKGGEEEENHHVF